MISHERRIGWNVKDICNVALMFFYLFFFRLQNVPVLSAIESTTFLGLVLFFYFLFSKKYRKCFVKTIIYQKVQRPLIWCLVVLLIAIVIIGAHATREFSILRPLFHQLIFIFVGVEFYAYLLAKNSRNKIIEYMIIAYSIQTLFQYLSFISPAVNEFTDLFKTAEALRMKKWYDGFRGNAISGSIAGGLACGYSIVTMLMLAYWSELRFSRTLTKYVYLVLLVLGGFAAGRISIVLNIVGIMIIGLYYFLQRKYTVRVSQTTVFLFLGSPIILLSIYCIFRGVLNNVDAAFLAKLETVKGWLLNMFSFYTLENDNNFWSDSYPVIEKIGSIWFGDGRYANADGTYYLGVDAGYTRMIGFGGILWLVVMMIYQVQYLKYPGKKVFNYVIIGMLLVATLKQDCIGISLQNQLILVLMYISNATKGVLNDGNV